MILIEDLKYSCIECIRGHRSSSCRHYSRPLLQVRQKGRPNVSANGNPNHRIAVFAEEIEQDEESHQVCDHECGSKKQSARISKSKPVVVVKCSSKQVIDLESGKVIGPYSDSALSPSTPTFEPSNDHCETKLAHSSQGDTTTKNGSCCSNSNPSPSHIVKKEPGLDTESIHSSSNSPTQLCCSTNKPSLKDKSPCCASTTTSKVNKSCGCNNKKRTINKSKILRTYLQNHREKSQENDILNEIVERQNQILEYINQLQKQQSQVQAFPGMKTENSNRSYSNYTNFDPSTVLNESISHSFQNNVPFNNVNSVSNQVSTNINMHQAKPTLSGIELSQLPLQHQHHQQQNDISNILQVGSVSLSESNIYHGDTPVDNTNFNYNNINAFEFPDTRLHSNSTSNSNSNSNSNSIGFNQQEDYWTHAQSDEKNNTNNQKCICSPNSCECANCEAHGIINGQKLDQYFAQQLNNFDWSQDHVANLLNPLLGKNETNDEEQL